MIRQKLLQNPIELRDVMKAILLTTGPVSTLASVKSTKMALHWLPLEQYMEAAEALEEANFGRLVTVTANHNKVFIKRDPKDVVQALSENPDLCTPEMFATRYSKPSAKAVAFHLRAKLVTMKLLSQKHFV